MRVLIAFDVDGTLETTGGPITLEMLNQLQAAGAFIAIVSPSALRPREFPTFIGSDRTQNLLAAKKEYPADLSIYVSDNGDHDEAELAGFIYIDRFDFR
jgi:hypothetical protein